MVFTGRSAQTRATILAAAQRRFAADGYERATIRAIAADADIDPSMVIRYFGTKADLYVAASTIDLAVPEVAHGSDVGAVYVRSVLDRWEAGENVAEAVLLRTAPTRPDAAARVQALFDEQVLPALRAVLPDDPALDRRAALLLSQILGVVYCRYLLGIEPLASMDVGELATALADSIQAQISGPLSP